MKKILTLLSALAIVLTASAQTTADLIKEQKQNNELLRKNLEIKPDKDCKKQAKQLKKEGWTVPAGEMSIEQQLMRSKLLANEPMQNENGFITNRYYLHTALATAGTYNAAYASARANALSEIAAQMETRLAAATMGKLDNAQSDSESAITVDKFHQRMRQIVEQALTNVQPVLVIYHRLPNHNFEVQVRLGFDKQELTARLKRNLAKDLEMEGDELDSVVEEIVENMLQ